MLLFLVPFCSLEWLLPTTVFTFRQIVITENLFSNHVEAEIISNWTAQLLISRLQTLDFSSHSYSNLVRKYLLDASGLWYCRINFVLTLKYFVLTWKYSHIFSPPPPKKKEKFSCPLNNYLYK